MPLSGGPKERRVSPRYPLRSAELLWARPLSSPPFHWMMFQLCIFIFILLLFCSHSVGSLENFGVFLLVSNTAFGSAGVIHPTDHVMSCRSLIRSFYDLSVSSVDGRSRLDSSCRRRRQRRRQLSSASAGLAPIFMSLYLH
ncbi:hypothetical protein P170DRAFT_246362 [Aspergillus steynii IBT 23096]|uniref:Uncharacterized protein n=1 Tax=Aspergillus steynii IBT 23096 TaxID=1392250 RepID=A0A2I2FY32_9EURO|nr:uncharacterized protein P170DRAFT_246362 [Aspergillus steynii IBT 23096]PLB45547.1 hypothetical protein P170DRAFT_246362 [Aspergillus steynii IBT 23096]